VVHPARSVCRALEHQGAADPLGSGLIAGMLGSSPWVSWLLLGDGLDVLGAAGEAIADGLVERGSPEPSDEKACEPCAPPEPCES
jgi:hypothetical protein